MTQPFFNFVVILEFFSSGDWKRLDDSGGMQVLLG